MPRSIPADIDPAGGSGGGGSINPKTKLNWIITGTATKNAIEAVNAAVKVNTSVTGFHTARFPVEYVKLVLAVTGVTGIALATPVDYAMDQAATYTYAPNIWGSRTPPRSGWTGRGAIVAIIDTGLDLLHYDFRGLNATNVPGGPSRVLEGWDMTLSGTAPAGFNYGTRVTASNIADQISAQVQTSLIDTSGHGTLIAGIAAANGASPNGALPGPHGETPFRYMGIAPEADLIVVKLPDFPSDVNIIDAVNYAFKVSTAMVGTPSVTCNLSVCSRQGPHDGNAQLDLALTQLVAQEEAAGRYGRHIVAAAGNEGNTYRHIRSARPSVGAQAIVERYVLPNRNGIEGFIETASIEGWILDDSTYTVGHQFGTSTIITAADTVETTYELIVGADHYYSVTIRNNKDGTVNGKRKISIQITSAPSQRLPSNNAIYLQRTGGASNVGIVDWYIVKSVLPNQTTENVVWTTTSSLLTTASGITSPASSAAVLSAGAYQCKSAYVDIDGFDESFGGNTFQVAPYSSRGPVLGAATIKPDLSAPGHAFVSSLSSRRIPVLPSMYIDSDGTHMETEQYGTALTILRDGGTSLSAAFVTGAVALVCSRLGRQTNAYIMGLFRNNMITSRVDSGDIQAQAALPNNDLGNGKLWLQYLAAVTGVDPYPTIPPPAGSGGGGDTPPVDPPIVRSGDNSRQQKWMDPRTGVVHDAATEPRTTSYTFTEPQSSTPYSYSDDVSLTILDSSSKQIYRASGDYAQKSAIFSWDGKTQLGAGLAPGAYFANIIVGSRSKTEVVYV